MRAALSLLCAFGLVIGAGGLMWLGATQWMIAQNSKTWPSVTGTIVAAGFESSGSGTTYNRTAFVQYRYDVDGSSFSNDRIAYGPTPNFNVDGTVTTRHEEAVKELANRSGGSDVEVYYNPEKPSDSVLLAGGDFFILLYLFGSLLMLVVATIIFLIATGRVKARYR